MSTKVLYISYDGMTDPLGQSQVIPYLAGLSERGYSYTLLSFEKPERYREQGRQIKQLLDQHHIRWVPMAYHKSPPVLSSLLDFLLMQKKTAKLHLQNNFAIVHCRSYLPGMVGMWMKRKFGTRFIFDMRGFWADERVEGGLWNLKNPLFRLIYRFFKKQEKQMLAQADYTISLTHAAKKIIHSWQNIPNQSIPIEVIPCCVDTDLFNPELIKETDQAALMQKLGIREGQFVLTYLGSLGTWYMLEEMLMFFKVLLAERKDAVFLFISRDPEESVMPTVNKLGIPKEKIILQPASRQKVPLFLSLSSASIFFIRPTFSKQASSATKMGEIMSMGIPFVTNRGWGDVEAVFRASGYGIILPNISADSISKENKSIQKTLKQVKDMKLTSYTKFDLEKGVLLYNAVYRKLIKVQVDEDTL